MSSTTTYEIETVMAGGGAEKVFFKCPVGGFASLRPGICPKCGELLMTVGASPVSIDDYTEHHMADIARNSTNNHRAGVAE